LKGFHQPKSHQIVETNCGGRRVFQFQKADGTAVATAAVRRGKSDPFDFKRKLSPDERPLITLNSFLSGYILRLAADKCDSSMAGMISAKKGLLRSERIRRPQARPSV
jgi:hypothetical protein